MNNNWHKKEKPLLGLTGLGGGVDGLAVVGAALKTYVDEVFSTYVYEGVGSSYPDISVDNGLDLSTEGGLVWIRNRDDSKNSVLADTVRGATKTLRSDTNAAAATQTNRITSFTTTGFSVGKNDEVDYQNQSFASWSFRKKEGFFDIVTYTGTGSAQSISHNLGSVPGCIFVKNLSSSQSWAVYHRELNGGVNPEQYYLMLNQTHEEDSATSRWNDTAPTATHFTVGNATNTGDTGDEYVAYIFAGGASTAATARSVDFDGSGDYLTAGSSSDFTMGTGDFTVECWVKADTYDDGIFQISNTSGGLDTSGYQSDISLWIHNDGRLGCALNGSNTYGTTKITQNTWHHVAITRASGTAYIFLDGTLQFSGSEPTDYDGTYIAIGGYYSSSFLWDGQISNFRVVKGTAVYTSSFKPPTEPLTSITNTTLLCCNNSSTTGKTTGGTITANGDPTASTDSPFDDPAGFKFGEGGDQNIIKMGSYEGNNNDDGTEVFLGWEPSFLIIKSIDTTDNWCLFDNIRGLTVDGVNDQVLFPNDTGSETGGNYLTPTSTGFKLTTQSDRVNNDSTYVYIAIRRPDGYVAKPASAGTDVFTQAYGVDSGDFRFTSNFPVDFAWAKLYAGSGNWWTSARLIQGREVKTNESDAGQSGTNKVFDSNVSWHASGADSSYISHMWKRGQGFDVVTYEGDGVDGRDINHSMNQAPEMIWIKNRSSSGNTGDWMVGHKDLNEGSSPWNYYLVLNKTQEEYSDNNPFNNSAPTATSFQLDSWDRVNASGSDYISFLFSSVTGISKLGSFAGSSSSQTITTGFAPRFILIKARAGTSGYGWFLWDSLRYSGSDNLKLTLNTTGAQDSGTTYQYFNDAPISGNSTGFTLISNGWGDTTGTDFVYYAHA